MTTLATHPGILYEQDWHPQLFDSEAAEIDAQVASEHTCDECNGPCIYDPWVKKQYGETRYRAFAVCINCGHAEEF